MIKNKKYSQANLSRTSTQEQEPTIYGKIHKSYLVNGNAERIVSLFIATPFLNET